MSGYTFTIADKPDPDLVGRYQAALAKLKPACTLCARCGKTLTASELKRIGAEQRARVCADRDECTLRQVWHGTAGMDLAGWRALRKRQEATTTRANVREVIATPAPIISTPVPVDVPPVWDPDLVGYCNVSDRAYLDSAWSEFMAPVPERETSLIGAYARMFAGSDAS